MFHSLPVVRQTVVIYTNTGQIGVSAAGSHTIISTNGDIVLTNFKAVIGGLDMLVSC